MYTAVVLDAISVDILTGRAKELETDGYNFCTAQGMRLPHHMTLNMGPVSDKSLLGKNVCIVLDGIAQDDSLGVIAAKVHKAVIVEDDEEVKSTNAVPHITIALKPGVKPVTSNKIDWKANLDGSYFGMILSGKIEECQ